MCECTSRVCVASSMLLCNCEKLFLPPLRRSRRRRGGAGDGLVMRTAAWLCGPGGGAMPPKKPPCPRVPTARHPEPPRCPNERRIWPQTAQGGFRMPSDALAAPQMPPICEIRPRGGTQKSVEGRWTHHVRCLFVPLTHRPDVCGWFGRWGRLGLRHQGGPLVSGRRAWSEEARERPRSPRKRRQMSLRSSP